MKLDSSGKAVITNKLTASQVASKINGMKYEGKPLQATWYNCAGVAKAFNDWAAEDADPEEHEAVSEAWFTEVMNVQVKPKYEEVAPDMLQSRNGSFSTGFSHTKVVWKPKFG